MGGCAAAIMTKDEFVSAATVISNMSDREKEGLFLAVQRAIRDIDATDLVELMALLYGNSVLKKRIIAALIHYFHDRMHLNIID